MLILRFFVPKVRKSVNNETKMLFGYFEHGFVFTSKKSDHFMRILGNKIFAFAIQF